MATPNVNQIVSAGRRQFNVALPDPKGFVPAVPDLTSSDNLFSAVALGLTKGLNIEMDKRRKREEIDRAFAESVRQFETSTELEEQRIAISDKQANNAAAYNKAFLEQQGRRLDNDDARLQHERFEIANNYAKEKHAAQTRRKNQNRINRLLGLPEVDGDLGLANPADFGIAGSDVTRGRTVRGVVDVSSDSLAKNLGPNLAPHAQDFIDAGKEFDLDPRFLAAIAKFETGNGTSSAFRNKNNAMGISNASGPISLGSVRESIFKQAQSLSRKGGFYDGANTIADIGAIYAPPGAGNDPNNTNSEWPSGVGKFYKEMLGSDDTQGTNLGRLDEAEGEAQRGARESAESASLASPLERYEQLKFLAETLPDKDQREQAMNGMRQLENEPEVVHQRAENFAIQSLPDHLRKGFEVDAMELRRGGEVVSDDVLDRLAQRHLDEDKLKTAEEREEAKAELAKAKLRQFQPKELEFQQALLDSYDLVAQIWDNWLQMSKGGHFMFDEGPIAGRLRAFADIFNDDPGLRKFNGFIQGASSTIAKGIFSDSGNLAEGDVKRALAAMPSHLDNYDSAKAKIESLWRLAKDRAVNQANIWRDAGRDVEKYIEGITKKGIINQGDLIPDEKGVTTQVLPVNSPSSVPSISVGEKIPLKSGAGHAEYIGGDPKKITSWKLHNR